MAKSNGLWSGSAGLAWCLVLMLMLAGCQKTETTEPVGPSVYLLNHQQWTPMLVLNFAREVAPLDGVGLPPATPPKLNPDINGAWRWEDPSRLVFTPYRQTIPPDAPLSIDLAGLKLREGYKIAQTSLTYRTPPLRVTRLDCQWQRASQATQRFFQAVLEFNYPVFDPNIEAKLDPQYPLPVGRTGTSKVIVTSRSMVRPAADGRVLFETKPGPIRVVDKDERDHWRLVAGRATQLAQGVSCQLPMARGDWDFPEEPPAQPPRATGISLSLESGKLAVSLRGTNLTESAKKIAAGQEVKTGVSLQPQLAGTWTYGDSASGPDLIFTPAKPLPLGTRLDVAVVGAAFPRLAFGERELSAYLVTDAMAGSVNNLALYTDPVDPRIKRITADLEYNHPLCRGSLEAKTAVRFRVEPDKSWSRAQTLAFELSYDANNPGTAHLNTAPIQVPERPGEIRIDVDGGVESTLEGEPSRRGMDNSLAIPSVRDYFTITEVEANTVVKPSGDLERLLMVRSRVPLKEPASLAKSVEAYLLPECAEPSPERPQFCVDKSVTFWETADQVDADILKVSARLPVLFR
ncbi:hypothetical protein, partial [Methylomagnum sp.]